MARFGWTVPTVHADAGDRALSRYEQIARGADQAGFDFLHIPWSGEGDSTLVVAGIIARATSRLRVLVETHAAAGSPVYLAKLFATAQRAAGGRLDLAVAAQREGHRRAVGERLTAEDASARLREFIEVFRAVWNSDEVDADDDSRLVDREGRWFSVAGGGLRGILSGQRAPQLYRPADQTGDADLYDHVISATATPGTVFSTRVLVRGSAAEAAADDPFGVGVVGDDESVAARLQAALDTGVQAVLLRADDPIGELYRVAQRVLPRIDAGRRETVGQPVSAVPAAGAEREVVAS